jgi:hypothetical protein
VKGPTPASAPAELLAKKGGQHRHDLLHQVDGGGPSRSFCVQGGAFPDEEGNVGDVHAGWEEGRKGGREGH